MTAERQEIVTLFKHQYESLAGRVHLSDRVEDAFQYIETVLAQLKSQKVTVSSSLENGPPGLIEVITKRTTNIVIRPEIGNIAEQVNEAEVGIGRAEFGIAQTGTIVEVTDEDTDRLISSLPRIHIAFLQASQIVRTLGDASHKLRDIYKTHGSNCNITFISGPSRTADIEMKLFLGVHGPQESHVIVCDW